MEACKQINKQHHESPIGVAEKTLQLWVQKFNFISDIQLVIYVLVIMFFMYVA